MLRNTHETKKKEALALYRKYEDLKQEIAGQQYIDIEPVFAGYTRYFVLREDYRRRKDANIFYYLLDMLAIPCYSRRKDFKQFNYNKNGMHEVTPRLKSLSNRQYFELDDKYKKFFTPYTCRQGQQRYEMHVPFYFVYKTEKRYITRIQEHSNVLHKLLAETENRIARIGWNKLWSYKNEGAYKSSWRSESIDFKNRCRRQASEQDIEEALQDNIN